jgi:tetratricopeptide (TPR) repeat protein
MRPKILFVCSLFFVVTLLVHFSVHAQSSNPQQTLNQYISDLQKNPNDNALREKIIKHVQTMRPAPAVPEEAKRYIARGKAAFKGAKELKDFNEAAEEFKKALLAAPWLAEGYYNLGIVQDKAGQYAAAMDSLKLYIMSVPNAPDVEKVKELIYEIEYRKEKAAKESRPEAVAAKKQNAYETWLKSLDGARFISPPTDDGRIGHEREFRYLVYYINGQEVRHGWIEGAQLTGDFRTAPIRQVEFNDGMMSRNIQNKQFEVPRAPFERDRRPCTATISDDGQFLTVLCPSSGVPATYTRVK